ncbi:MAG TPA: prepilin-type N-terminal cleavage/methylation domain-containing protein [Nocardioides sp.]|uniref:type II secretion system protein n=1 Tax=Nocardioides sp. TaxID=35761 RepID=UPI002E37B2A3|nr:prepilin-type N-terminal cleavage/methylation domain-containing protein [Nocardioides sp.]HEX5088236.1 prepilin-type N-terminal cleavage/methylation domain-containing protein [Nocardioides sp.]
MLHNHLVALRKARKGEGGFTLIELLIVIVILGVLAGIVVFSVRGIQDRGETAACRTEVKTVETAVEAYYAKHDAYPTSLDDLNGTTDPDDKFLRSTTLEYATLGADGAVTGAC